MIAEAGAEWPTMLQSAVLSANSNRKRATGFSSFYLMFGREFNHLPLLRYLNSNYTTTMSVDEKDADQLVEDSNSWTVELEQSRAKDRDNARCNIHFEQAKQKRLYNLKVETKRLLKFLLPKTKLIINVCLDKKWR